MAYIPNTEEKFVKTLNYLTIKEYQESTGKC